jgi:rubrerythrin
MTSTLNDLLDVVIRDEINAQKFYMILSEKSEDQKLKKFFISLANEEKGHELILHDMKSMEIFDGSVEIDEESLEEVEGAHIIDDAELIDDMTIEDGFQIAMKREIKAVQVYRQMAETTENEEIMKLLFRMVSDEQRHYDIISQTYKMHID